MRQILTVNKFSALRMKPAVAVILVIGLTSLFWHLAEMEDPDQSRQNASHASIGSDSACAVKVLRMFVDIVHSLQTNTRVLYMFQCPVH
jgi:hypothetical protein